VLRSPDGSCILNVYFNDAGAMHSGNHWTWIIKNDIFSGKSCVAQGYMSAVDKDGPFPATWDGNEHMIITFRSIRIVSRRAELIFFSQVIEFCVSRFTLLAVESKRGVCK